MELRLAHVGDMMIIVNPGLKPGVYEAIRVSLGEASCEICRKQTYMSFPSVSVCTTGENSWKESFLRRGGYLREPELYQKL